MPYYGSSYTPPSNERAPLLPNKNPQRQKSHPPNFGSIPQTNPQDRQRSLTVSDANSQRPRLFPEDGIQQEVDRPNQAAAMLLRLRSFSVPRPVVNMFLAVCTVVFMVAYVVVLPLYTGAFSNPETGSDAYLAILLAAGWFPFIFFGQVFFIKLFIDRRVALRPQASWSNLFLVGCTMAMNGILLGLSSPPERTPPHLQSLLQTMLIPCTVLARIVLLRKGISRSQLACLFCLFIGLFISLEPSIFNIDMSADNSGTGKGSWVYTLIFAVSWLPAAVGYVLIEKGQKPGDDSMVYMAWVQVFLYSTYLLMVWADFIPVIGMAASPKDFFYKLQRGFLCLYGGDPKCRSVPGTAVAFILSYCFGNMFNLLLIRYAESAVYSVVVLALVTPLATIFWTFFSPTPHLHWRPVFNSSTIYLLVGLVIMMPSVVMYSMFSNAQAQEELRIQVEERKRRRQERAQRQKVAFNDNVVVHEVPDNMVRRVSSEPCLHRINE